MAVHCHGADAVGLLEDGERAAACVEHGGAQLLAGQVGGLGDAALLERHDRCGRVVVDHHHRHGLVLRVGVVGVELHHGGQVGKPHVVRARGHALHRAARAVAGVHRHVQARRLEVALGHGLQEQGGRAFKTPVQLELDGRALRMRCKAKVSQNQKQEECRAPQALARGAPAGNKKAPADRLRGLCVWRRL
jgi:hypothetical protein